MDRAGVTCWVEGYERAWRTAGTDGLPDLFADDVAYRVSPWAGPITGLEALQAFWEDGRDGPHEAFTMSREIIAVDGDVAVLRVSVEYAADEVSRWSDLWVLRFDGEGRCAAFEEWPFAPGQVDGHEAGG